MSEEIKDTGVELTETKQPAIFFDLSNPVGKAGFIFMTTGVFAAVGVVTKLASTFISKIFNKKGEK